MDLKNTFIEMKYILKKEKLDEGDFVLIRQNIEYFQEYLNKHKNSR